MDSTPQIPLADLVRHVGEVLGVGSWHAIDQERVDAFAEATEDRQWIHVDPQRAATGPYGRTIAHGYLTLSLLPHLASDAFLVTGVSARVNYGLDRVRFPAPLPVGSAVRDRASLLSVEPTGRGTRAVIRHEVEIRDLPRPACIAETVTLFVPDGALAQKEHS
jgi:acyl dehydratase